MNSLVLFCFLLGLTNLVWSYQIWFVLVQFFRLVQDKNFKIKPCFFWPPSWKTLLWKMFNFCCYVSTEYVDIFCINIQVREQQRYIALQIRQEVERRRQRELEQLGEELRQDWERQQREKLQTLQRVYQESLQLLGQGHRSAKENVRLV